MMSDIRHFCSSLVFGDEALSNEVSGEEGRATIKTGVIREIKYRMASTDGVRCDRDRFRGDFAYQVRR